MTNKNKKAIVLLLVKTGRDSETEKQSIKRKFKHLIMTGLLGSLTACRFSLRGILNPKNPAAKDSELLTAVYSKASRKIK